jgi:hypothetical protein
MLYFMKENFILVTKYNIILTIDKSIGHNSKGYPCYQKHDSLNFKKKHY